MTTTTPTFKMQTPICTHDDSMMYFSFMARYATKEECETLIASMPKMLRPHLITIHSWEGITFGVEVRGTFPLPTEKNAKNETAIKRFRKFVAMYGDNVTEFTTGGNHLKSLDEAVRYVNKLAGE